MRYENVVDAEFLARPNRFIAKVKFEGEIIDVHVKNTGRCRELLVPGATVYLEDFRDNLRGRKLEFSLIGVEKKTKSGEILTINMDSQAPNKVVYESLKNGKIKLPGMDKIDFIKPEAKFGESRLDFYVRDISGSEGYIEVKGVTLENNGIASFPDAPTERGIKHLKELEGLKANGYNTYVIFVIQMEGMKYFEPNIERHPEFADALKEAKKSGVNVLAYECCVTKDTLEISKEIEVRM